MGKDNQLPAPHQPGWYYRLSAFFRQRLGSAVHKIPIDAGFTCPNRDGTVGRGGCSYCYNPAFSPAGGTEGTRGTVTKQIKAGMKKNTRAAQRYLAYFQAYTNTYSSPPQLQTLYDEALLDPRVIGLSVATRPDCISEAVIKLLENYARRCHVWLELGLQSAHNVTLQRINRGHTYEQFQKAVEAVKDRGIFTCAHVILGLPGETREMALYTMKRLNECGVDGVKFHHLQIIKGTSMERWHQMGEVPVFESVWDYIPLLCDCLEHLNPQITIHRLAAQVTDSDLLLAPIWPESAGQIATGVERELKKRGSWQGTHAFKR